MIGSRSDRLLPVVFDGLAVFSVRWRKPMPQKPGETLDGPNMGLLSLVAHSTDTHVFDHARAQWGGPLLLHGNLLSDD